MKNLKNNFTCIGTSKEAPVMPADKADWENLRRQTWLKQMCENIANGETALKDKLPVWTPRCAEFQDNHRKQEFALKPNHRLMFDIDEKGKTDEIMALCTFEEGKARIGQFNILMIEESARRGTHILVDMPSGMTPEEAQKEFAALIGEKVDTSVKNVAGCIFMVSDDHQRFVSDAFFEAPEIVKEVAVPAASAVVTVKAESIEHKPLIYDGLEAKVIWKGILRNILYVDDAPSEGMRNNTLFKAAVLFRYVCNFDFHVLKENSESWGLDEQEVNATLRSALEQKRSSRDLKQVEHLINKLKRQTLVETNTSYNINNVSPINVATETYKSLPPMPKVKLPRLFQLLFKLFPKEIQAQVFIASLPMLGALLTALRHKRNPLDEETPCISVVVEGPPASGKSFIGNLADLLLAPLFDEEERMNAKIENWKRVCESMGNSKDKPLRPKNTSRIVYGDFTLAALNEMMFNTYHQICIMVSEEFDTILQSCGGKFQNISAVLRKGNDGARSGQRRVGLASVNGSAKSLLSFVFAVTPERRKKILNDSEDGLVSRIQFVSMDPTPGIRAPKWGNLTEKETAEIKSIVDGLWHVGLKPEDEIAELERRLATKNEIVLASEQKIRDEVYVKMPRLTKLIEDFDEERIENYELTGSVSEDTYSHRIPQLMRRAGMILFYLYGCKETNDLLTLVSWLGERQLQETLNRYGNDYDEIYINTASQNSTYKRNGHNIDCFNNLPNVFSREDVKLCRQKLGLTSRVNEESCINTLICRLMKDNHLQKIGDNMWKKIA